MKNVADKKFTQFIGSILKYKDKYPRFRLFGRFLQLHDELTESDLKLYVDLVHNMFKHILNFAILEQDELVLIPTVSQRLLILKFDRINFCFTFCLEKCIRLLQDNFPLAIDRKLNDSLS